MKKQISTRRLVATGMLAAISAALMYLEMPLPMMPPFLKLDISAVPVMLGSFAFGPAAGVEMALIKALVHMASSQTQFVGELADFLITGSFALTAGLVYRVWHTRRGALAACGLSILVITVVGALANWFILLPFYAAAYMPYDAIIAACQAINPAIDSLAGYILFGVVPFNLIKGTLVALVTFIVYKRISGVLHRWVDRELRTA